MIVRSHSCLLFAHRRSPHLSCGAGAASDHSSWLLVRAWPAGCEAMQASPLTLPGMQHNERQLGTVSRQDPRHPRRFLWVHAGARGASCTAGLHQLLADSEAWQVVDYVVYDLQGTAICNVGDVAVAPESVPEQTFTPVEWGLLELCQVCPLLPACHRATSLSHSVPPQLASLSCMRSWVPAWQSSRQLAALLGNPLCTLRVRHSAVG